MNLPPDSCTVLVAGGGPGGSYTAAALAREGIDVVLLEADQHPRYHVGEGLLASLRALLSFIDLEEIYDKHGFQPKRGAVFKLNAKREAFSDFLSVNGARGWTYNVVRSESDEILFRHAARSGARTFENTRLESLQFESCDQQTFTQTDKLANPGRPVSACWSTKAGHRGTIKFEYFVDATGRNGIMSTKYLKNRRFNDSLKNIAIWGYFEGAKQLSPGTHQEGQPISEGMRDGTGWIWCIPLHNGTLSVGAVVRQDLLLAKKKALSEDATQEQLFRECLKLCPTIHDVLGPAKLISEVRQASDYSYSAPAYAGPYFRLVGDAGCFVDPFFSSGHHIALSSGLNAALTIAASIRGDCVEVDAARYHSKKVTEMYTLFLIVVMASLKQIRLQDVAVLHDFDESDFDKAFDFFKPIITGSSDRGVTQSFSREDISKTIDFCFEAVGAVADGFDEPRIMSLVQSGTEGKLQDFQTISEHDMKVIGGLMVLRRTVPSANIDDFESRAIDGLLPRLEHRSLGLKRTVEVQ